MCYSLSTCVFSLHLRDFLVSSFALSLFIGVAEKGLACLETNGKFLCIVMVDFVFSFSM